MNVRRAESPRLATLDDAYAGLLQARWIRELGRQRDMRMVRGVAVEIKGRAWYSVAVRPHGHGELFPSLGGGVLKQGR